MSLRGVHSAAGGLSERRGNSYSITEMNLSSESFSYSFQIPPPGRIGNECKNTKSRTIQSRLFLYYYRIIMFFPVKTGIEKIKLRDRNHTEFNPASLEIKTRPRPSTGVLWTNSDLGTRSIKYPPQYYSLLLSNYILFPE